MATADGCSADECPGWLLGWNYGCYNLREYITAIIAGATQLVLRIFYIYGADVLLDELYFGQQPTTSDTDDAHLRRLLCSPNGYRIIDVDVTKSQNSYDVTLNSAFAGHGFPLFAVDETQVPPDTNISFTRIASATAPISGTFDLTLRGQTLKSIPVDIGSDDITAILEQFDDIGVVQSGISDHPFNRYLMFTFDTYAGNLEQIHLNATLVGGINPTAYMHTVRDGEYRIDPLYGEMLQTAHGKHQVTVTINDVPSRCTGSCTYEWSSGSTPVINNITHVQELPYTTAHISGNGFSDNLSNNIVTIGGIICNVTMATSTLITCDIDNVTGGEHTVAVDVLGSGLAKYGDGNVTIFFSTQIDGIKPTMCGLGGSVNLSINGRGFSGNSNVTVGSKTCDILSVTTARIVCLLPPTSVAEVGSVTVHQNGVLSVMADKQFSYNESVTPRVTSISPESTRVLSGDTLIVIGDGFEANDTVTLLVGLAEINITFHNNSYLTASLPPCSSGSHPVKIIVGENGAALTSSNELPTITCTLEVTSVNPLSGSLFGGTQLTLTGSGFTPDVKVKVGTHECDVTSANDDQVICLIARTRNVHRVNNLGNHPAFGKYYYWSPQHIKVLVGDIVRWDWDFPFYITTMKPKVEETYNITTKYGKSGGFSSGVGTSSGSYSREFSKAGKFYYWSGIIDPYSTTWFHGSVEVVDRTSFLADVTVSLGNFEATYNITTTGQTPSTPDNTTCINPTDSRNDCSDPYPVQSTNSSKIPFAFWTCRTPVIEAVSRQNGTTNDEILISGDGFSGVSCANEVAFGDYLCESSSSSVSFLICNITVKNTPRVGRPQYLNFLVNGQGYAQVNLDSDLLKTFTLLPLVRFLSPTNGSRGGHTRLTISGTGFEDGNLSIMTEVTVGGYTCGIVSISYMQIVCLTPSSTSIGHREVIVVIQTASNTRIPANCDESCQFVYDDLVTPTVTDISPSIITGENTTLVTIVGTGFGDKTHNVNVSMTSLEEHDCLVINVSDSEIICSLTNLPLGLNQAVVDISDKGRALYTNGDVILTSLPTVSAILPKEGSIYGGTYVTVAGNGFSSDVTVQVGGQSCEVKNTTLKSLIFITPAILYGVKAVTIQANGVTFPVQTFNFTDNVSPKIFAVNPSSGTRNENITITGFNLGNTLNQTNIFVGASECRTTSVKDTEIKCTVGSNRAGTYNVYVNVHGFGDSNDDATFTFNMTAKSISPNSGSLAGDQTVTLSGTGFDDGMVVTICGDICYMSLGFTTDSAQYVCKTPHSLGSFSKNCTVQVSVNGVVETLLDAYTYDDATTPVVDYLTPKRGGTAGGTRITIFGSNFGSTQVATFDCTSSVTIAGTLCNITSWTNTQVVCVTEAHSRSERAVVRLETGCNGKAKEINAGFHFVDVWSSAYTWGGTDLGLPTAGDIVVIQKGQTILLDTDTPVLKMLLIQGGELVFDEEDVELQAENILITDGGLLQVGTEAVPFQHKAVITLHGHVGSKELPIYGTKSLIVREGTLDLHGAHVPITWTKLATSAAVGDTQITLQHKVTWQKGDTILITTTGGINSQYESETATITSIAMNRTITLNSPLTNQHHGISEFVEGRELNFSAEVGLLTRNIVIRGFKDSSQVTACPDGFDPGYFEVSTCFQGRQEGGNRKDQFGAHVIIHTTDQTKQLTTSRIEFVEFVHVGQAFRLGRHPINFHVTGDMSKSYVRGCGIHDTFNRAINIRDTHNLLVERNVIYNVNGAAIYLEDGTETGNLFQYNLGVLVKGSSQLLNDDISAATFWITNPNNTFRHNVAAGGTHFGYWIYLENIAISSLTGRHRPQYTPLGEFNNNTAHSLGWYGLWIYPIYTPRVMYAFDSFSSSRKAAVINNMYVWNCRKGIEIADMGAIHIRGLIAVNNVYAGYEGKMVVEGNQYTDDGPLVENSLIVGYVPSMPSQGCTNGGVVSPYKFGFTIRNVSFVNFDQPDCSALTITRIPEQCDSLCGGYMYRTQNLTFTNVDSRVRNDWIWESVYEDMDGSLCGYDLCKVVPCTETLPTMCTIFSQNATSVPLCTCPSEVKLFRFAINPFTYSISATTYYISVWPLLLTNKYGTTQHQYRYDAIDPSEGWMTNFVSGESYQSKFNVVITLTNITYNGYIYRMQVSAGYASFGNVEFFHTGQFRYSLFPHYPSLTYRNVGTVTEDKSSFVTKCTFHHGFSSAVGVYGTNSLVVTGNVMHHSVLLAIETQSFRTTIHRNLVVLVSGSSSRFGAISGMGSKELTLTDNSVSGTNGVAFHVPGVECGLTSGPSGNEAHSSSIGLAIFPGDNVQGSCYQVSNYFIWKCYDIAIYYNNRLSVVLINNTMAENTLGIYNQIIGPSAAAHLYAAKQCTVKDSIIIGTTSSYNCTTDQAKSTGISSQITGGHVGLVFASFMQGSNSAPFYGLTGIRNYPAIMGIMNVEGVTFAHFKTVCGTKDVMLTTNKANDDGQHPVVTRKITKYNSEHDSSFFIHRPNIEKINPRDCVDMDCDGLKKALIRDEDGTFLGSIGSVLSQSEWEWNGVPNRGLGDYRIPLEMLTTLTGERINVSSIAPHKGMMSKFESESMIRMYLSYIRHSIDAS
ncbi:fibrocystin-L-like [Mizuhopecten yessoensis]|uniref:fibrocystin-L-like n=1 Tax=Mizuhopecten yessoensis TaxID=6573 RepID=UPI000B458CBB|nr:fibrocystin-L-like [Mizuhopecten yessoensis]